MASNLRRFLAIFQQFTEDRLCSYISFIENAVNKKAEVHPQSI